MEPKKLINLLSAYNPGNEHITLSSLFAKLAQDEKPVTINSGSAGGGKSESSIRLLKLLGDKNHIVLDNTTTPRGLFETVKEYPAMDLVLDECSTLLSDKKSQEMLKQLMQGGVLTWTKKDSVETTEPYQGAITINTNEAVIPTVADRAFVNRTKSDKSSILEFNNYYVLNDKAAEKTELVEYVRTSVVGKPVISLTPEETQYVLSFVAERIADSEDGDGYSRRIITRLIKYFAMVKTVFGTLDNEVKVFVEPFAEAYISNKTSPGLIESLVPTEGIEKPKLVRLLVERSHYSEQYVRVLLRRAMENKKLVLDGKMVRLSHD